jgi:hypothetical protein
MRDGADWSNRAAMLPQLMLKMLTVEPLGSATDRSASMSAGRGGSCRQHPVPGGLASLCSCRDQKPGDFVD